MKVIIPRQRIRYQRARPPGRRSLYWGYGSNMNWAQMTQRCKTADPVSKLLVPHTSLVFRGVADVISKPECVTPGGLWHISPDDERALDSFEGVNSRFYLKKYFTIIIDGEREDVLFYQMWITRGVMPPSQKYIDTIEQGYRDFDIDMTYLDRALAEAWNDKEITPRLRERHIRKGRPPLAKPRSNGFFLTEEDLREAGAT